MKLTDLDEPTSHLDHVYLGCTQRECKPNEIIIEEDTETYESRISAGASEKLPGCEKLTQRRLRGPYEMEGHARTCVERHCELAIESGAALHNVPCPCPDDHQVKGGKVCSQIVGKCLYLARIG